MKLAIKIILSLVIAITLVYFGSALIMPSVTIKNASTIDLVDVKVVLPSNNLDFGAISAGTANTLHYTLDQADGVYNYLFTLNNQTNLIGSCGSVTDNEINKHITIELNEALQVTCD